MFSALPGRGAHGEYAKFPPAISLWTADCGIFGSGRETVGRAASAGVRDRLAVFSLGQELADARSDCGASSGRNRVENIGKVAACVIKHCRDHYQG